MTGFIQFSLSALLKSGNLSFTSLGLSSFLYAIYQNSSFLSFLIHLKLTFITLKNITESTPNE